MCNVDFAFAKDVPICMPLPEGYLVSLEIQSGSISDTLDAMACLGGLYFLKSDQDVDVPISISATKVPWKKALSLLSKETSNLCLKFSVDDKRILLEKKKKGCRKKDGDIKKVRAIFDGANRVALITSSPPPCPPRTILNEHERIQKLGDKYYSISVDIRTLAERDPMAFISEGAAFPTLFGFPAPGFILTYVRKDGIFDRLGLMVGDVVMSINGIKIRSILDAFEAYSILQGASVLVVEIKRLGETLIFVYEFR